MKICGITRVADAQLAVALGATAVGFVLWRGSRRAIAPERAREIVGALPPGVVSVAVFVNEEPAALERIAALAGVCAVQLHGDESAEYCQRVTLPVIKAVRLRAGTDASVIGGIPDACTVLVDSFHRRKRGGTGQVANWERAREIARERRTVLAGGLHAGNVADAICAVAPWGVDVSSGVESSPGIKDAARMRAFFGALQAIGESSNDDRL